ncbi:MULTISPECIES: sigma-E processing peptidase SpoIIGA [Clostridium]|uniref:Sporulation sigma-E factor-processing peptidase n=2 Tax=root TaxID=1 RepID=R9CEE8_9CLOT|nr:MULTISPECIES: sigma-E processing peptidase SpoIIGA [Clostridium]EOR27365.1 sigma-E processing peptidase spoiiga [Clostridium sartagoforme AAU1]KLE16387.1 peptidase U4 [Clostridium sp. C8]
MVVYIDILIIENFFVNLFLLLVTMKVLRYKYGKSIYFAAIVGAFYTVVLFLQSSILTSLPIKLLVVLLMNLISTKSFKLQNLIKSSVTFIIISFTLCGFCFAFSIMDNQYSIFKSFEINNYSIKYLLISIMILYIVVVRITDYLRERALIKNFIYEIEIFDEKNTLSIKGLLDTGNALREPVTNLPCIIIENDLLSGLKVPSNELFYIPYSTIGEEGNLKGFKSEKVRIKGEGKEWKTVEVIICSCKNKLSKENEFNALLSRGVI